MSDQLAISDSLFHGPAGLDPDAATRLIAPVLETADDGELFLEYSESEVVSFDDGRIRTASFDSRSGFGLRAVTGESAIYAHAGEISVPALTRAVATLRDARADETGSIAVGPRGSGVPLYTAQNPFAAMDFGARADVLAQIDAYARAQDRRVVQVTASLSGEWQVVEILRADGSRVADVRPLVVLSVSVVMEQAGRGWCNWGDRDASASTFRAALHPKWPLAANQLLLRGPATQSAPCGDPESPSCGD